MRMHRETRNFSKPRRCAPRVRSSSSSSHAPRWRRAHFRGDRTRAQTFELHETEEEAFASIEEETRKDEQRVNQTDESLIQAVLPMNRRPRVGETGFLCEASSHSQTPAYVLGPQLAS